MEALSSSADMKSINGDASKPDCQPRRRPGIQTARDRERRRYVGPAAGIVTCCRNRYTYRNLSCTDRVVKATEFRNSDQRARSFLLPFPLPPCPSAPYFFLGNRKNQRCSRLRPRDHADESQGFVAGRFSGVVKSLSP